ncbi:hypothetical protein WL48_33615 [Burkholderia ubonensis]|uniref:HupE/UreJ family protein n=1 Tax=Burkholderia ubonensis TaxID=101571 RepID=UPI00075697DB|nr:HupE/UreJ family protein [Burkholderia ubonensis]KVT53952.1 hypothetical protein WK55_21670 [Burkholderia ubonensis]KWC21877.1 hypothetical protein WL48_33615 [Burkholderia ubonensis]KWC47301.1 hypothetical protein WL49_11615 [Burkholderia ubonensis]
MTSTTLGSTGRCDARVAWVKWLVVAGLACAAVLAHAHGVSDDDKAFIEGSVGINLVPYIYLGAKHMVTGYDHLLFLVGVIFFLYRLKDVGQYVTLFAIGHSTTLLVGVIANIHANPYLVDAIIGLSVAYKALDNLGAFRAVLGFRPNTKAAVLIFGFCHGFGLATKLQELSLSQDGRVPNIIAFNVGVEIGQLLALSLILLVMNVWRRSPSFTRTAVAANTALMTAGFVLTGFQLMQFLLPSGV